MKIVPLLEENIYRLDCYINKYSFNNIFTNCISRINQIICYHRYSIYKEHYKNLNYKIL